MSTFALIRTNTGLTTNVKLVIDSDGKLYLESFDSNQELADSKLKKYAIKDNMLYEEVLNKYWKGISPNTAFDIKYENDNDKVEEDFEFQHDDIYLSGCDNVKDTDYKEEFECLAPLHFTKNKLPKNFILFRADGPGLINLTNDNFNTEVLDKFKVVKVFDLTNKTKLGKWLETNITNNERFPDAPFEIDFRDNEPSVWNGIDYEQGGYTSKKVHFSDDIKKENTFFEFDKSITDGFKDNKLVYPNIFNFKFLFDDTPATQNELRKWSINRYYGFYLDDMKLVTSFTGYNPVVLKHGLQIKQGNLVTDSRGRSSNPFKRGTFRPNVNYYVEMEGEFYLLKRFVSQNGSTQNYKIISDLDLTGKEDLLNKNIIEFGDDNSTIKFDERYNEGTLDIEGFDDGDVWVIEINGEFHRLSKNTEGNYYINSDYGFNVSKNILKYWINKDDINGEGAKYNTTVNLSKGISKETKPPKFNIYKCNFTDVKDFDYSIVNTKFSDFEYEESEVVILSDETKLYTDDPNITTLPTALDTYDYDGEVVGIPVSSEYVATRELFEIEEDGELSAIWRKNPLTTKWAIKNSLSSHDYPYRLNNSTRIDGYNRAPNPFSASPVRSNRNLDYFYTINPDDNRYINHSLHITFTKADGDIDTDARFNISNYFNQGDYIGDYFSFLFGKKESLADGSLHRCTEKYSRFNIGDDNTPNSTLFRGIRFNIESVRNVQISNGSVTSISTQSNNEFEDYKFSILLANYDKEPQLDFIDVENQMEWTIIEEWQRNKIYNTGSIITYLNILFISNSTTSTEQPGENPSNSPDWDFYAQNVLLWNPVVVYEENDIIFDTGEYWDKKFGSGAKDFDKNGYLGLDFWNPRRDYVAGEFAFFKNNYYRCKLDHTNEIPPNLSPNGDGENTYWEGDYKLSGTPRFDRTSLEADFKWARIKLWEIDEVYDENDNLFKDDSIYRSLSNGNFSPIDDSSKWAKYYNIVPNTNKIYAPNKDGNNMVQFNGYWYLLTANPDSDTLDNGINVYINKKWKNIMVNIYINDNTILGLENTKRDDLYKESNSKLTTKNFINSINDISKKYGFINFIKYYVIEEDGSFNVYDENNYIDLPYIISTDDPDGSEIDFRNLIRTTTTPNKNLVKVSRVIKKDNIDSTDKLNWYSDEQALGVTFKERKSPLVVVDNNHGLTNIESEFVCRFSGDCFPIFKTIPMFRCLEEENEGDNNYRFDSSLSDFGILKEFVVQKVSLPNRNVLLFGNNEEERSIYPMIDEFGYCIKDHFIFKSTWDKKYYKLAHSRGKTSIRFR